MDSEHVSGYIRLQFRSEVWSRETCGRYMYTYMYLLLFFMAKLCPTLLRPHGPFVTPPGSSDHRIS